MDIHQALEQLGLRKNKGAVYLAALAVGSGSASTIAARARLPRTTTIQILEALMARGLISFTTRGRKRVYSVEDPDRLILNLQDQLHLAKEILPELRTRRHDKYIRPRITIFEGAAGIRSVHEDVLTMHDKKLDCIYPQLSIAEVPGGQGIKDFAARRIMAGISTRVLRPRELAGARGPGLTTSPKELREVRFAPAGLQLKSSVYLFDRKVCIISTKKESVGIIAVSSDLHDTMRSLFDVLWEVSQRAPSNG